MKLAGHQFLECSMWQMSLQTNGEPTSKPLSKAFELLGLEKAGKF
jgi:hypothetical protein